MNITSDGMGFLKNYGKNFIINARPPRTGVRGGRALVFNRFFLLQGLRVPRSLLNDQLFHL
jgi:hypothetical protein